LPYEYDIVGRIPYLRKGDWLKMWGGGRLWRWSMTTAPSQSFHKRANMPVFEKFREEGVRFRKLFAEEMEDISFDILREEDMSKTKEEVF
jgi:hypothetical protein